MKDPELRVACPRRAKTSTRMAFRGWLPSATMDKAFQARSSTRLLEEAVLSFRQRGQVWSGLGVRDLVELKVYCGADLW